MENVKIAHNLAENAKNLILELGFDVKNSVFISDEKIWNANKIFFSNDFLKSFKEIFLIKNPKADLKNLENIKEISKNSQFILCLGSGTINDLCKLASFELEIPYAIFTSAASMNGYLSKNASITILGHKKTLPATLAKMIFCDLDILKSSPIEMTKAGIGDAMCFYNCWFDWYLSHKILGTEFNEKPFEILQEKMNFFVNNSKKFSIKDDDLLKLLIEILLLSGQGMTIAKGSYPASQAEHLIAHIISMKYEKIVENKLHGDMIAVTSLTAAKLQKKLLNSKILPEIYCEFSNNLEIFFDEEIVKECKKEYQKKVIKIQRVKENISSINWQEIKNNLKKIHFDEKNLKEIFDHFRIDYSTNSLGISKLQYDECVDFARLIRDRFTCLDFIPIPIFN